MVRRSSSIDGGRRGGVGAGGQGQCRGQWAVMAVCQSSVWDLTTVNHKHHALYPPRPSLIPPRHNGSPGNARPEVMIVGARVNYLRPPATRRRPATTSTPLPAGGHPTSAPTTPARPRSNRRRYIYWPIGAGFGRRLGQVSG